MLGGQLGLGERLCQKRLDFCFWEQGEVVQDKGLAWRLGIHIST